LTGLDRLRRIGILTGILVVSPTALAGAGMNPAQTPVALGLPQSPLPSSQPREKQDEPTPDARGVYKKGPGLTPPQLIKRVEAIYVPEARKKGVTGVCVMSVVVDSQGNPQNIKVVFSIAKLAKPELKKEAEELDASAVRAVSQYRFKPGEYQGDPVPVYVHVEVQFR